MNTTEMICGKNGVRTETTKLFINGRFVESSNLETFKVISPSTCQVIAEVFEASVEDTNAAVASAKNAQPAWAALSVQQRGTYMKKLASLLRENSQTLAYLDAVSMGRPISENKDVYLCANFFDYFAEAGWQAQEATSLNTPGILAITLRQPYGVAAAIVPWNAPAAFFGSKTAPMLAAGNCVVLKSSEKAPLTAAYIAGLVHEVGFPPGVVNVIHGHGHISGATLSSHMDVRVLSFTGSGRTGRLIAEAAAGSNLKNVYLELGGKSPAIIFDDADIDAAAKETQHSITWNTGQLCMASSRIYVQDTVAEQFIATFKENCVNIKIGASTDSEVEMGPLADEVQFNKVKKYIELGKNTGCELILSDKTKEETEKVGYFVGPHIFTNVSEESSLMKEEIFGPVVVINTFKSEEEAMKKANDIEYGLYASVYTKDVSRAIRFAKGLEAGTVGVNCTSPTQVEDAPFGGYKASGVGREGFMHSLENFLEEKTVLVKT